MRDITAKHCECGRTPCVQRASVRGGVVAKPVVSYQVVCICGKRGEKAASKDAALMLWGKERRSK